MNKWSKRVYSLGMILLGNFLYALAVRLFLMDGTIVTGGATGISLALGHITGIRVSLFAIALNSFFWVLGLFLLGKHFAAATLLSTLAYPVFLNLLETLMGDYVLTEDPTLCAVLGGLLIGASLGLVLREDASTGGVDVIPMSLNRYLHLPVSACMYAVDALILLAQVAVFNMQSLLYGLIHILVYSIVLDKVLTMGTGKTELKIISKKHAEICSTILKDVDRGVTLLEAKGGYTGNDTQLVLTIISPRQLPKVEKLVHALDENALIIVSNVSDVSGRGFTMEKQYL